MGCWQRSRGHDRHVLRLREVYGGPLRRGSLTVAGVSAVGGSLAGVLIGTTALAGHESPTRPAQQVAVHDKPTRHHHHSPTPTPYVATTYSSTPSGSPSATPTPSKSARPAPKPTTTSPAPQPTTTSPAPKPTSPAPTSASASPAAAASPGTGTG